VNNPGSTTFAIDQQSSQLVRELWFAGWPQLAGITQNVSFLTDGDLA
jgi:hypothetical protein